MTDEDAEQIIRAEMEPSRKAASVYADSLLRDGFDNHAAAERLRQAADFRDWYERTAKQECARDALLEKAAELSPVEGGRNSLYQTESRIAFAEQIKRENSLSHQATKAVKGFVGEVREQVEWWRSSRGFIRDERQAELEAARQEEAERATAIAAERLDRARGVEIER